ncbi:hypothetical protein EYF80_039593 [Liparis tanakae]|uniref:Uncharacterized protein n=1 Tax=Liparis tanakae TaxID=230148 RepID=A0A4Z2G9G3_9TELE|nr:hypothetical protein EYF80_039593 [Liparis tanakae]
MSGGAARPPASGRCSSSSSSSSPPPAVTALDRCGIVNQGPPEEAHHRTPVASKNNHKMLVHDDALDSALRGLNPS